ncbi:MAG: hypothetical protein ACP5OA_03665 [Candidatus Woesearchaeota archaeon]
MNNIIRTGLCALLIGVNSPAMSDSILEKSVDTTISVQQEKFVGPDAYYSIGRSPKDFGFTLVQHLLSPIDPTIHYDDTYMSPAGVIKIGCMKIDGGLQELYDLYSVAILQTVSNGFASTFKDGEGMRIVGKGLPKKLLIDNNPALQGGAELWSYKGDITKGNYGKKYDILVTVVRGKEDAYMFTLAYTKDGTINEIRANAFYNEIIKSFDALK